MVNAMGKQLIPAGYKQTEVGVIPESWRIGSLDNFWNVTDCKHVTAKFVPNGYPLASIQEVQSRFVDLTDAKQTTYEFFKLLTDGGRRLENGDLLLSRNATVGEVAQVMDWHPEFAMGQDVCLLRRKNKDDSPVFLQELFLFSTIKNQLDDCMVGTTFKRVNVKQIKALIVQMPSHQEQTAIANALSDVDALIAALEKLINKKSAIKTAAMQQLLTGKKRLPPFDQLNTGYKQTELGEIPGDWEVRSYGEVFSFLTTANNARSDLVESGEIAYIHYGDIHTKWNFSVNFEKDTTPYIEVKKIGNAVYLKEGDVIMADASEDYDGIGKSVEVKGLSRKLAISGLHTFLLRDANEVFVNGYRGYLHTIKSVKQTFDRLATGLKVYGISKNNLKLVLLPIPPKAEQKAIANVLSDMDKELEVLQQRLHKTQQIKQGMMQELLTGKTRLISGISEP